MKSTSGNLIRDIYKQPSAILRAFNDDTHLLARMNPGLYGRVENHLRERAYAREEAPWDVAAFLAVARYEELLQQGLTALAGKLRASDLTVLLETLQGFVYDHSDESLASMLEVHYGWDSATQTPEEIRELLGVLDSLTFIEHVALGDVLERIAHVEMPKQLHDGIDVAARYIGLKLKAEA